MTAMLLAGLMTIPAMAATKKKKINTVTLTVKSEVYPDTRYGEEDVEVETRGENYAFDYYEIENVGFSWTRQDVPQIAIYLKADDGYEFAMQKASAVKLTGATYYKATTQDEKSILKIIVNLPPLAESVGEMTLLSLADNGFAVWEPVDGAASYDVRLYRNGEGVGVTMHSTTETWYNFQKAMSRSGSYRVKVRPVNGVNPNNKGAWFESEEFSLTEEQARAIRDGEVDNEPRIGHWGSENDSRWYYIQADGNRAVNQWLQITGDWYFFGADGYMQTGWIDWNGKWYYCDESGKMLVNTTTPDGHKVTHDGSFREEKSDAEAAGTEAENVGPAGAGTAGA